MQAFSLFHQDFTAQKFAAPTKNCSTFTALKNKVLNFATFQEFSGQQLLSISHVHFNGSSYWMLMDSTVPDEGQTDVTL